MTPDQTIPATRGAAFDELGDLIGRLGSAAEFVLPEEARTLTHRASFLLGALQQSAEMRGTWPKEARTNGKS